MRRDENFGAASRRKASIRARPSLLGQLAFDGMRKHLRKDFQQIDHIDLHVPEMRRKGEKLEFVATGQIPWQTLPPDAHHNWLVPEKADEYRDFLAHGRDVSIFIPMASRPIAMTLFTIGTAKSSSNACNSSLPAGAEVYRHKAERRANWPDHIKWSETLKNAALRGETLKLDIAKIVRALYRPQRLCHRAVPRALCRPSITREDVFHYLYALLHHPVYRERFAANLKRELPRIPFAPDFHAFAQAGRELARLHVDRIPPRLAPPDHRKR